MENRFEIRNRIKDVIINKANESEEIKEPCIDLGPEVKIDEKTYSVAVTVGFRDVNETIPDFSRSLNIVHDNALTGYKVKEQRQKEIDNLINEVNK